MKPQRPNKSRQRLYWLIAVVLLLIAYVTWVFQFSYPSLSPTYARASFTDVTADSNLPWPGYGQSAIGIKDYGILQTSGTQTPAPMASTAKLITALCVLQKDPIANINASPVITLSQSDVDIYNSYVAQGGSVVPVVADEKISEYQMIEAMLLPSANNMADSLAIWAFGSLSNYSTYANNYLQTHNLIDTHIGNDASGFDPSTTSTAGDLVNIGDIVMSNSILSQIVSMTTISNIPVAGTIKNVNSLLGMSNIVGIKTGNTTQAGGVYISASDITVDQKPYILITALMGGPTLWRALNDSYKLIGAAQTNFQVPAGLSSIKPGTLIGTYSVPWSKDKILAESDNNISLSVWEGSLIRVTVSLGRISDKDQSGANVGTITATYKQLKTQSSTNVHLANSVPQPSKWWLLLHPNVSLQL